MGAWSVSITGNDTAADLRYEYEAAFSHLPPEEAVERLDAMSGGRWTGTAGRTMFTPWRYFCGGMVC